MTDRVSADMTSDKAAAGKPAAASRSADRARRKPGIGTALFTLRGTVSGRVEFAVALGATLVLLAFWEIAVDLGWWNKTFMPAPSVLVTTIWRMLTKENLLWHSWISTYRVWGAFLLSAVMAVPIGILMSSFRGFGAALEPLVDFIRYLPVPALVPVSIIWFGVGEETKFFLLWLGTFFQLVLLVADDMRRVPNEYIETAYTLGARPIQVLNDVAFRAMLPSLFDNLRISLGWCWTYVIIAEIVAADSGLGYVIWTARRFMNTPNVMSGVVVIGIIGLLTDQILRRVHKRLFRYI